MDGVGREWVGTTAPGSVQPVYVGECLVCLAFGCLLPRVLTRVPGVGMWLLHVGLGRALVGLASGSGPGLDLEAAGLAHPAPSSPELSFYATSAKEGG